MMRNWNTTARWLVLGTAFVLLAGPSLTAAEGQAKTEKTYQPGELFLRGSRVYIHVGKTGFGHEHAVEGRLKSGRLNLAAATGELTFDMTSFVADTAAARKYIGLNGTTDPGTQKKVNANMRGHHILDVDRYPTATFQIHSVTKLKELSRRGMTQYRIDGHFTLHGKTNKISFIADAAPKGGWLHLRGKFSIRQTDYGITPYSTALGAIGVADGLTISGDLWLAEHSIVVAQPDRNARR